jgi:Cdc6-like AAA superfamily ATPase
VIGPGTSSFVGTKRFDIRARLGAGGMGVVYLAYDRERCAEVALKTLSSLDGFSVALFKNEFRALADLQHPNLVRLYELFAEDQQWFFTMELVLGVDFLAHVRGTSGEKLDATDISAIGDTLEAPPCQPFDEVRLRESLRQLALGVVALHQANKVHRDIKPSNILVQPDGRVVLLDFGLVTEVAHAKDGQPTVVGTARYMAPEQAAERPVGPEADWYAVGTVIYEAMTGQTPFVGKDLELLVNKTRFEPPRPRTLARDLPEDLDALCVELLRMDPLARPRARQILVRLGAADAVTEDSRRSTSLTGATTFVGRQGELAALRTAYEDVAKGSSVTVLVYGESGLGKSSLMARFTERLKEEHSAVLVLEGCCYERESVPYKAFDGILDCLTERLSRMDQVDAALLLTPDVAPLVRLFPGLRRVPAVSRLAPLELGDLQELRTRAFSALRNLLHRIAVKRPLVLCIDDFQWSDADSLTLLADLLHPPGAPPLLLLGTVQTGIADEVVRGVAERLGEVRHLPLEALPSDEAERLAKALAGTSAGPSPQSIALEAAGHPLFIHELVRHVRETGAPKIRLDDVLWSRVERLEEPARRLLAILSVAALPLRQATAAQAADLDADTLAQMISLLRVAHLVRRSGTRGTDYIETYHNRIRQAVLHHLAKDGVRALHARLADALEAKESGDAMRLVHHLEGAGEHERAALHATRGARVAAEALAFDHAARLYRTALRLGHYEEGESRRLSIALGDALAQGGKGAEAAAVFQAAAEGANETEALDLSRRAAEQLLLSGHVDEGMAALVTVLGKVGLAMPRTARRALLAVASARIHVAIRGLGFRVREESQIPPALLARVDACWAAAIGLANVDYFRSAVFQMRHLLLALRLGEPYRLARGLATEASFSALAGAKHHARTVRLLGTLHEIAEQSMHPHAIGLASLADEIAALLEGRWKDCLELAGRAELQFRERCAGLVWERSTMYVNATLSLWFLGETKECCQRVGEYLRGAEERGDHYGATTMRTGHACFLHLVADDPDAARHSAQSALRGWSKVGVIQHVQEDLLAQVSIDLYEAPGGKAAWEQIQARWRALESTMMLRIQLVRIMMVNLRAGAALAAAASKGRSAEAMLREAESAAKCIERAHARWGDPLALLVRAGIAAKRHNEAAAVGLLERAARGFVAADMALYARAADRHRGQLLGGTEGARLVAEADAWMAAQAIRQPARMAVMLAPGFGHS